MLGGCDAEGMVLPGWVLGVLFPPCLLIGSSVLNMCSATGERCGGGWPVPMPLCRL